MDSASDSGRRAAAGGPAARPAASGSGAAATHAGDAFDLNGEPVLTAEQRAYGRRRVHRFSKTERWLHASHATAFLLMLLSGLVLYLPFLAQVFGNRPVVKAFHLAVAALWLAALVLVPVLGDRRILRRTRQQFESLDREDLRWLRSKAARAKPQPRFNGGMKLHAIVQAALTILFFVSGTLIWLGERNTSFRLSGTVATHDMAMFAGFAFVIGHLWIAFSPKASPSLSGIVDGTVPASYAAEHHAAWNPDDEPVEHVPSLTPTRFATAGVVVIAGVVGAALLAGVG